MRIRKFILPLLSAGALAVGVLAAAPGAYADGHERGERHEMEERGERKGGSVVPPAGNEKYRQECSSCHFLYQPGLLPARSWEKLMAETGKHFGEDLALDEAVVKELSAYLAANGADKQTNRRSVRIADSIGRSSTPVRITDVPYIQKEHRKISKETFARPSIKTFSNCGACHTKGAEGNFEEDFVKIPKN